MLLSFSATVNRGMEEITEKRRKTARMLVVTETWTVNRGALHLFRQLFCDSCDANSLHIVYISTTSCSASASRPASVAAEQCSLLLEQTVKWGQRRASTSCKETLKERKKKKKVQKAWEGSKDQPVSHGGMACKISSCGQGRNCECSHC